VQGLKTKERAFQKLIFTPQSSPPLPPPPFKKKGEFFLSKLKKMNLEVKWGKNSIFFLLIMV